MNPRLRPKVEAVFGILVLLTPRKAVVEGSEMLLAKDRICIQMALSGTWEPRNTRLLRETIREGDIVVDIGAHIGYHTLILSKLVGDRGHVYAFEPDALTFSLLRKNVEMNGCRNVTLERKGLSDKSGSAFLGGWTLVSAAGKPEHDPNDEMKQVEILTLDDFFGKDIPEIAFMKIDIEGHEINAVRGAVETLRRSKGVKILTEFDPFRWLKGGINPREYLDLLSQLGFRISVVDPTRDEMETIQDFDEMLRRYNQMGRSLDLFCVRDSLAK